jgi:tryptophan synthase alpha chain
MNGRIEQAFAACRAKGKTAFIPYVMAGDPSPTATLAVMHALVEGGADVLELGFPFSDPTADGASIQAAGNRALVGGMSLHRTLELCRQFRTRNSTTPIILMGYANPVMQAGYAAAARAMRETGIDGVIIVDLPPEQESEFQPLLTAEDLALIRLVAPTTQGERLQRLLSTAGGFVYTISINGITGSRSADASDLAERIAEIRQHTRLPIVAGFGIRTPEDAAALKGKTDGVVVGSALVEALHHAGEEHAAEAARAFAAAMSAVLL